MPPKVRIGKVMLEEEDFNKRIIAKIPKEILSNILQEIEKELEDVTITSTVCHCHLCQSI
jgi:hypothetical protein